MGDIFTDTTFPISTERSSKRIIIDGQNKITYLKSIDYFLTDAVEGAAISIISPKRPSAQKTDSPEVSPKVPRQWLSKIFSKQPKSHSRVADSLVAFACPA